MGSIWELCLVLVAQVNNLIRQTLLYKLLKSSHQVKSTTGSNNLTRLCHMVSRHKRRRRAKILWRQRWRVQTRAKVTERMQVDKVAARALITTWTISNTSLIWFISVLILNRMLEALSAIWTKLRTQRLMTCPAICWDPASRHSWNSMLWLKKRRRCHFHNKVHIEL